MAHPNQTKAFPKGELGVGGALSLGSTAWCQGLSMLLNHIGGLGGHTQCYWAKSGF